MRGYLKDCTRIEQTVGQIYRELAKAVTEEERLEKLFLQLARDEEEHAQKLSMAEGIPPEIFFRSRKRTEEELDRLLLRAAGVLGSLQRSPVGKDEALDIAVALERDFMRMHLDSAVEFKDEKIARLFGDLARADEEHLGRLESYLTEIRGGESTVH